MENLQGREVEFKTAQGWNEGTVINHNPAESRLIVVDHEGERFVGYEWEFSVLAELPRQREAESYALEVANMGM